MKTIAYYTTAFLFTLSTYVYADIAVIVHPNNTANINASEIAKIFLGKKTRFDNLSKAIPLLPPIGNQTRINFLKYALSKNETQYSSYWSRLIFTGKASPPLEAATEEGIINMVSKNEHLIGVVDTSYINESVKVVGTY